MSTNRLHPRVPVGECTEKISTCTPATAFQSAYFDYIDIGAVDRTTKSVTGTSRTIGTEAPSRARQVVHSGDVLVSTVRPNLNAVARVEDHHHKALASTGFCVLRPKAGVLNSRYLFHWVKSKGFINDMVSRATGANYPAVSDKTVKTALISLPSMSEQERIADVLDTTDALCRKDKELLQKYDELAQSIFYEMFGDPLGSSDNRVPLSSVVEINPSKREARVSPDTPVSFLPMTCVGEDGSLELSQVRQFKEVSTGFTYFREDDVLFAKITPCMENGKGAIARGLLNGIGFGSTEFHVLRPTTRTTSEFIYTLLHLTNVRKEAANNMTGSGGQQRVPRTFFDALCITVPPVELQKDFSKRLSVVRALRARALSNIASSTTLFDSLLSKYFV